MLVTISTSGFTVALFSQMAAYTRYSWVKSSVPTGVSTLPVLSSFGRHTVMAGLTFYAPIIGGRRARR